MNKKHTALEYATLLGRYLEKLGFEIAYEMNPEYPEWAGFISICPGGFRCNDTDWQMQLHGIPRIFIDDDGEMRLCYEVHASAESISEKDELYIMRLLNESPYAIKLRIEPAGLYFTFRTSICMNPCNPSGAKRTADFIREKLYSLCCELGHIIPRAGYEMIDDMDAEAWRSRPFFVKTPEDIDNYIEARAADMQDKHQASDRSMQPRLTEWDPAWGDPAEVLLRSEKEYEKTGRLSALIMYNAAADYLLHCLLSHDESQNKNRRRDT